MAPSIIPQIRSSAFGARVGFLEIRERRVDVYAATVVAPFLQKPYFTRALFAFPPHHFALIGIRFAISVAQGL